MLKISNHFKTFIKSLKMVLNNAAAYDKFLQNKHVLKHHF